MYSKNVRLIHLMKSCGIGGVEKSTIKYSNLLIDKLGFIGIYASKGLYDSADILDNKIKRFVPRHNIGEKKYFFQNLINLLSVIKKNEITHIHYHQRIYIPFIYLIRFLFRSIKIIYTNHTIYDDFVNNLIIADNIIALNQSTNNDLPFRSRKKSVIIPHGVSLPLNLNNIQEKPINIGFVGRFVEGKGIFKLLKAFNDLLNQIKNTKLILVGEGYLKNEIIRFVKIHNFIEHIEIRSPKILEGEIYKDIKILVVPSEKLEGFGLVILEAMALQIPVVVNDFEPFYEIIENKVTGIISKNFTSDLFYLLNNEELYNNIKENAYNLVREKYNLQKIVEKYLEIIYK